MTQASATATVAANTRVRLRVGRVGTGTRGRGWCQMAGDEVPVSAAEAERMIADGQAELAETAALDHRKTEQRSAKRPHKAGGKR